MKKFYTLLGGIALAVAVMTPGISAQSMPGYSMLKYTISPADGSDVNELETIIIDFPDPVDGIDAHILTTSIGNYATLTCGSTVIKAINLEAGTHGSEISKAYIYFPKTTTPGTYTFQLAESALCDFDQRESHDEGEGYSVNPPITATYTIKGTSGIDKVEADGFDTPATIYDLFGRRIKEADVNKLDSGIYIVNGKKVFVTR